MVCCIAVCNGEIQCKSWSLWSLRCGSGPPIQQHWQISQPCEKLCNPYQGVLTQSDPGPQKAKPPGFDPWDGEPDRAREEKILYATCKMCSPWPRLHLPPEFHLPLYFHIHLSLCGAVRVLPPSMAKFWFCKIAFPRMVVDRKVGWKWGRGGYLFLVFFAWLLAPRVLLEDLWPMITIPSVGPI